MCASVIVLNIKVVNLNSTPSQVFIYSFLFPFVFLYFFFLNAKKCLYKDIKCFIYTCIWMYIFMCVKQSEYAYMYVYVQDALKLVWVQCQVEYFKFSKTGLWESNFFTL